MTVKVTITLEVTVRDSSSDFVSATKIPDHVRSLISFSCISGGPFRRPTLIDWTMKETSHD